MHVDSIYFASSGCIFGMGLRGLYIQVQHMEADEAAKERFVLYFSYIKNAASHVRVFYIWVNIR